MAAKRPGEPFPSPTVTYQYASGGVEEILRPTLVVSGGRSYRKLTDIEFGRRPEDRVRERDKISRRKEGRTHLKERARDYSDEQEWSQESPQKSYTG